MDLLAKIYEMEKTERIIANKKNKYSKHYRKWHMLIEM